MKGKDLKDKMRKGERIIGMYLNLGSQAIKIAAKTGFDCLYMDFEHKPQSLETFAKLARDARLAGLTTLVRVTSANDNELIMRALDAGASGIVVPQVKTREEAINVVKAAKYPPEGIRGFEPVEHEGIPKAEDESWVQYLRRINEETSVIVMIEDKDGVNNFEEISSVKGIDMVFVGKADLALSLGVEPDIDHPTVMQTLEKISAICRRRRMPLRFAIGKGLPEVLKNAKTWIQKGRSPMFLISDIELLENACKDYVSGLKQIGT